MDLLQFVLFVSTVTLLTIVPGPNFLLIVGTLSRTGRQSAYDMLSGSALIGIGICFLAAAI